MSDERNTPEVPEQEIPTTEPTSVPAAQSEPADARPVRPLKVRRVFRAPSGSAQTPAEPGSVADTPQENTLPESEADSEIRRALENREPSSNLFGEEQKSRPSDNNFKPRSLGSSDSSSLRDRYPHIPWDAPTVKPAAPVSRGFGSDNSPPAPAAYRAAGYAEIEAAEDSSAPALRETALPSDFYKDAPPADYYGYRVTGAGPKPPKSKAPVVFAWILAVVFTLSVAVLAGTALYNNLSGSPAVPENLDPDAVLPEMTITDRPETGAPAAGEGASGLTSAQVVDKVIGTVVGISNYRVQNSFNPDSEGSGIVMTDDGYIVTNAHVVENATNLTVVLENGDTYPARIVGSDARSDLAVIKVNAVGLQYAEFGNSDQIRVGDPVLAMGNPNGAQLAGSVTKGIVSGLNRSIGFSSYSTAYIQTDAAINPGNSGGALVNEFGQVIGINSAKLVATDFEGIGFAIPINEALPIINALIENGRVAGRAELGITGHLVDQALAELNGTPTGVGIVSVKEDSDLAAKGVRADDIITHVEGEKIFEFADLSGLIEQKKAGEVINLTIYRPSTDESFTIDVKLMEIFD